MWSDSNARIACGPSVIVTPLIRAKSNISGRPPLRGKKVSSVVETGFTSRVGKAL